MTTEFTHLDLDQELEQAVNDLGYSTPTQVQDQVIPLLLEGKDVIAQSETGSGKNGCFRFADFTESGNRYFPPNYTSIGPGTHARTCHSGS